MTAVDFLPAAPLPVGPDTPFRATGEVAMKRWKAEFARVGSPMHPDGIVDSYWACRPVSALVLHLGQWESTLGRSMVKPGNWLGLRIPGSLEFVAFPGLFGPVDCVKELVRRWTDPTYKNGVYMPRELSLAGFYAKYAPPFENPTEQRIADAVADINLWRGAEGPPTPDPTPEPPREPAFGLVPKPPIRLDVVNKPEGYGWSNYGPRDQLVALVFHNVLGRARYTGDYFRNPNEPHGYRALTDWGVCNAIDGEGWDGVVLEWNDPDGPRSPWASGADGGSPYGDGRAIMDLCRRLGRNLNQITEAIEISRLRNGDAVSAKCLESIIHLSAWRVDTKARVSYKTWPRNNHGVQMTLTHAELGKPGCNAGDVVSDVIAGVGERLKFYQLRGEPVPPPVVFPGLTIPMEVFKRMWPASLPPDPKGPFTAYIIANIHPRGHFPEVRWLERVSSTEAFLSAPPYLLRFKDGTVTEVKP